MGIGGISIWQLLIILVIVILIFGTKRLKNIGGDLGGAVKGFKDAVSEDKEDADKKPKAVEATKQNANAEKSAQEEKQ